VPFVETQRRCERFCVRVPTIEWQCKKRCLAGICSTDCFDVLGTKNLCSDKCVNVPVTVGSKVQNIVTYDFTCTHKSSIVIGKKAPVWNVSCEKSPIGFDSAAITRLINQDSPTLSEVLSTFPVQNNPVVMYISRGLGVSILPMRIGTVPEISYFEYCLR